MRAILTPLALSPVLVPQALWVKYRAARLSEAAGPRDGVTGQGPELRLLIVGDSSGAGVGVSHQDDALAGRLAAHLGTRFRVHWRLAARCGATTASVSKLLDTIPDRARFDAAVIALGVNDAKNGMRSGVWMRRYAGLCDRLVRDYGVRRIYASGLPQLGHFPLLPQPLRGVLGQRAARFDAMLRALVEDRRELTYISLEFPIDRALMAEDGFHPGPEVYDAWARRVAERVPDEGGHDVVPYRRGGDLAHS
ncbi:MAG: SGNH/GDSL hydrolase family protein [Pseudomonadota bacterium]